MFLLADRAAEHDYAFVPWGDRRRVIRTIRFRLSATLAGGNILESWWKPARWNSGGSRECLRLLMRLSGAMLLSLPPL